ncbi:hypothetical protein CH282_22095 [Rhodococcus sp. 06-418-1B]|nr:hypothetical protein [Rhodococcus sp. 06-418-1B]OZC78458.1 hypothetical protein CH282_22095 [Rhodococcus sp. 06-418-1B]
MKPALAVLASVSGAFVVALRMTMEGSVGSGVVCAVVAFAAAMVLGGRTACAAAVLGVLILAVPFSEPVTGVAAGLVVGGLAAGLGGTRATLGALVVGTVAGFALSPMFESIPRRYADYLPEPVVPTTHYVAMGVFAVLLLAAFWAGLFQSTPETDDLITAADRRRFIVAGLGLPACLVAASSFEFFERWPLALLMIVVFVGAAFVLPGSTGMVVLAALVTLASVASPVYGSESGVILVAALVAGLGVGWRWSRPVVALALLAVGVVAEALGVFLMGMVFVPLALGMLYASVRPSSAPATVIAVTAIPLAAAIPITVQYGWTAYTPLTSALTSPYSWLWATSLVAVAASAVGVMVLQRRRNGSV